MPANENPLSKRAPFHRFMRAGRHILEGPRAIFPPGERDWPDWLECDLRMVKSRTPKSRCWESICVYVDHTMNKDDYFLIPIVRQAKWHRSDRPGDPPDWPNIEIAYGQLHGAIRRADAVARRLQTTFAGVPLQATGLCLDRTGPALSGEYIGERRIRVSNGTQAVEFNGPLARGSELDQVFEDCWENLSALIRPISRSGWLERYDYDLSAPSPPEPWDWDGEPR